MRVALQITFAVNKKEPLDAAMERIHQAFLDAGIERPVVRFSFSDSPLGGSVSSVDRVLRRYPELGRFVTSDSPVPGIPGTRRISNGSISDASNEEVAFSLLQTIAAGIPRSFPFHLVAIHFHSPEFGNLLPASPTEALPGVLLTDNWWVNGRNRSLSALVVVEADPGSKALPSPQGAVAAVLAACGKVKRTVQIPLAEAALPFRAQVPTGGPAEGGAAGASSEVLHAVQAINQGYRARLKEVVEQAALPHELPPLQDALRDTGLGVASGPKKPVLERLFKPMGYTCRGDSGTFTLRRRTGGNLTVELYLDVGTWSRNVTAIFRVLGLGFRATLGIPVAASALDARQYPIGDSERWQKIVENLAALVAHLDRSFVPEIEAAAGPSPEWYQPDAS